MTVYELDVALAEHRRASLLSEAAAARLTPFRPSLRSRLATVLRSVADAVEPSPVPRTRTAS